MPWLKTSTTYYRAQLGLQDKDRAIKEWLVYCVLLNLNPRMFGQIGIDWLPLLDLTLKCHGQQPRPYKVINRVTY